jgi:small GTP-binding protein
MSQFPVPPERAMKTLKAVLVGESTVGKTSILTVANTGHFDRSVSPTVGACFVANNYTFADRSVRLNIWDTAGQERYRALAPMYYREMDIGCLVYAIDSRPSFEAIDGWYEGILRELPNRPQFYLIGNKRDLADGRAVSEEMGAELAAKIGAEFCEVSAMADCKGVIALFEQIARKASEQLLSSARQPQPPAPEPATAESQRCC